MWRSSSAMMPVRQSRGFERFHSALTLHKVMQGLDALLLEDGPELRVGFIAFQEVLSVFLAEGLDERVAVLAANLTVLVTVPLVESGLLHGCLQLLHRGGEYEATSYK